MSVQCPNHFWYFLVPLPIVTEFNSFWTTNNPRFTLPDSSSGDRFYVLLLLTVTVNGTYRFRTESSIPTYGLLYSPTFDPTSPLTNLIVSQDGRSNSAGQIRFEESLQVDQRYYLVVASTDPEQVGAFALIIRGSTTVDIAPITGRSVLQQSNS